MPTLTDRVIQAVEDRRQDLVNLCRELVRINTVNPYAGGEITGSEGPGQEHVRPILDAMGGRTHLFEPPADTYERLGVLGPRDRSWKGRPNLVTTFDLGAGPTIIVNSHMDTVGVDDMVFDPFCAKLENGTIYGRGTSDDKGGLAAGIMAIQAVLSIADQLGGTIIHESVVDEECNGSGAGTLACCLAGYRADEAIVIDGGGLTIMRGCQGCQTADIRVQGRSGHAAQGGVNAIDKAVLIKQAIDRFKEEREAAWPGCLVNLGIFRAGIHPAVVPGAAELSLNIVYHIQEAAALQEATGSWGGQAVRQAFEQAIRRAAGQDDWLREHPPAVSWVKDLIPFEVGVESPLVHAFAQAWKTVADQEPEIAVMPAWADAANLVHHGQTPALLFGPGTRGKNHGPDESVEVEDLIQAAKVVAVHLANRLAR